MTSPRRSVAFAAMVTALAVGACGTSQGAVPPTSGTIGGIGDTPVQLGEAGSLPIALPTAPPTTSEPLSIVIDEVTRPEITDDRVFMVGDSVLQAMANGSPDSVDLYVASLGWDITIDAVQGRFTDEGLQVLRKRRGEVHQVLVAMLGNNYGGDSARLTADVDEMLAMFPEVRMFVMFTVPLYDEKQNEVNLVLRGAAQRDNRLVLIDWETVSKFDGAMRPDGVHPTAFGADLLGQMVGVVLGRSPDAPPDVTIPQVGSTTRPTLPPGTDTSKNEGNSTPRPNSSTTVAASNTPAATSTTVRVGTVAPTTTRPSTTVPGTSSTSAATTIPDATSTTGAPDTTEPATTVVDTTGGQPPLTDPPPDSTTA